MKNVLFTISNHRYVEACKIMLSSFLLNNNQWYDGDIIIIYDDLNENDFDILKTISDKIIFYKVQNKDRYNIFFENPILSKNKPLLSTYYKFECFNPYFCEKYDYGLWLDSDIICNSNIKELFDNAYDFKWCEDRISTGQKYFNAGVFAFSYEKVKDGKFYESLFEFGKNPVFKNPFSWNGDLMDQDIFNEIVPLYFNNINVLDPHVYNKTDFQNPDINGTKIIHYCGYEKPFYIPIKKFYFVYFLWYYYFYLTNKIFEDKK